MSTDAAIVTGVRSLWEQGHFQDLNIQVDDCSFRVHKLIMASVSDYFHAMLTGGMAESSKDTVQVGVVSAVAMEKLINFIYKDKMELAKDNVAEVLNAAMYLQIPTAVNMCVDFMVKNVSPKDCFSVISIFQGYSLAAGVTEVKGYIASNVKRILDECVCNVIPYEEFCFLMDNWHGSEMDLFPYVKKWVDADYGKRKQHLNNLLCKIRFCLMNAEELQCVQDTKVYRTCPGSWQEFVDAAVEYLTLPLHARVLHDSEQSKLRSEPRLLCLYVENGDQRATSLNRSKEWASLDLAPPSDCVLCKTALCVNDFLIISPSYHGQGNWYIFDPRTVSWLELPYSNIMNDGDFAAVFHQRYLYVLGGSYYNNHQLVHDHVERYDFQTNQWSLLTKLPDTRSRHAACAFQGNIYVSGGRHQNYFGGKLQKVDCLNLSTLVWEAKAPMLKEAEQHFMCVMKLHGKDVIFVVHEDFQFEYYNVSTDQWMIFVFTHEQFPHSIVEMSSRSGLITKGNTLYFLDDQRDGVWNNDGQCLEITFPEEGTDVTVTSIEHFETNMDGLDYHFYTHGAVLSLPEHKLPALEDKIS